MLTTCLRGAAERNTARSSSMNRAQVCDFYRGILVTLTACTLQNGLFGGRKLLTGVKCGDDKKSPVKLGHNPVEKYAASTITTL